MIVLKRFCTIFLPVLFYSLFISCNQSKVKKSLYYPIDSLIQVQATNLSESQAILTKHAEINGEEETNTFTPKDSTAWLHELDIFVELKTINKPINMGSYTIENSVKDANSNLTIRSFTSTKELPVSYLKIFYLDSPSKIKRIESLYREETSLLKGSRLLIMEFQEINGRTILVSYSIEGTQKMFLGDSVQFSVKGIVTLP